MREKSSSVSVIIVHYQAKEALFACLSTLMKSVPAIHEVIVVDNDEEITIKKELLKKFPSCLYLKSVTNVGYGEGNNRGASVATGEYVFFLNPDTTVTQDCITTLVTFLKKKQHAGVVAPLLKHPDGTLFKKQGALTLTPLRALFSTSFIHRIFPRNPISKDYWLESWDKKQVKEVDVVPGTAFMIRKSLFDEIGGFDKHFFLYFEEFDYCRRVKNAGYSLFILPQASITHTWGVSTAKRDDIKTIFRNSQYYYFKKYYGTITAVFLDWVLSITKFTVMLTAVLLLGTFLRTYQVTELFMFIGDHGWFYLSAWDLLMKGTIPLVGIPSSVVWLHQGPLATYLIAFALWIGKMNPIAPAVFFSLLDVGTIYLVYLLGKKVAGEITGLSAAFLYATSPLVLISARMPYHTSPIPFFACVVFLLLGKTIESKKYLFWLLFSFGLLLQLELSNGIVGVIILTVLFYYRNALRCTRYDYYRGILGFCLGIIPFILYDLTHHFIQTLGFPLWVINRIRLFLGITTSHNSTTHNLPKVISTIWDQVARIIFPYSEILVALLLVTIVFVVIQELNQKRKKLSQNPALIILLSWVGFTLASFIIHAAPGDAYFPLVFPGLLLLLSFSLTRLFNSRMLWVFTVVALLGSYNAFTTVANSYYVNTDQGMHLMPPRGNNYGAAFYELDEVADFIANDADGHPVSLTIGGFQGTIKTGGDHFTYLLLSKGVKLHQNATQKYTIYDTQKDIPKGSHIIFHNPYFFVSKEQTVHKSPRF